MPSDDDDSASEGSIKCLLCKSCVPYGSLLEHIQCDLHYQPNACKSCSFRSSSQSEMIMHGCNKGHPLALFAHSDSYYDFLCSRILNDCINAQSRGLDAVLTQGQQQNNKNSPTRTKQRSKQIAPKKAVVEKRKESRKVKSSASESSATVSESSESSSKKSKSRDRSRSPSPITQQRKRCRLCNTLIIATLVEQFRHASKHLPNLEIKCPFCNYVKTGNAHRLEKHVRSTHPRESFSLLNIREKRHLRDQANSCFPSSTVKSSKPTKSPNRSAPKAVVPPAPELMVPLLPVSPSRTVVSSPLAQESPSTMEKVSCAICTAVICNVWTGKKMHVTRKHMGCAPGEVSDGNPQFLTLFAECFPDKSNRDMCCECQKLVTTDTGKRNHVMNFHYQRPVICPYTPCAFTHYVRDELNRHMKKEHEIDGKRSAQVALVLEKQRLQHTADFPPYLTRCFPSMAVQRASTTIVDTQTATVSEGQGHGTDTLQRESPDSVILIEPPDTAAIEQPTALPEVAPESNSSAPQDLITKVEAALLDHSSIDDDPQLPDDDVTFIRQKSSRRRRHSQASFSRGESAPPEDRKPTLNIDSQPVSTSDQHTPVATESNKKIAVQLEQPPQIFGRQAPLLQTPPAQREIPPLFPAHQPLPSYRSPSRNDYERPRAQSRQERYTREPPRSRCSSQNRSNISKNDRAYNMDGRQQRDRRRSDSTFERRPPVDDRDCRRGRRGDQSRSDSTPEPPRRVAPRLNASYRCHKCQTIVSYQSKGALKQHVWDKHLKQMKKHYNVCKICSFEARYGEVRRHVRTEHPSEGQGAIVSKLPSGRLREEKANMFGICFPNLLRT